jgi:3',5'-cyclic AMP phosphodiesterase CpdA
VSDGAGLAAVAVIGDLHFGHVDGSVCRALLEDLRGQPPELVVVAGDLTQRARRAEFRAARAFLASLPAPFLVIPGNHDLPLFDLPLRLLDPYGRYRRYIHPELEPQVITPSIGAIGIDATGRLRHKDGRLTTPRIERAARRLRAMARPFRVVAVHQPLAALHADDRHHVADGATRALASWLGAGADLVVGGHVHRGYCMQVDAPGASAIVVQAGTAISTRRRHGLPNSYFRIELAAPPGEARRMRLLRRDHDDARGRFETRSAHTAVADANGWRLADSVE